MNTSTDYAAGLLESAPSPNPLTLVELEQIIERSLPKFDEACFALLEIHKRKLYKAEFRGFEAYLEERWRMSRSRGYQLLHYARVKRLSTMVDSSGPANERQAREISTRGHISGEAKENEYFARIRRMTTYLTESFRATPLAERPKFITELRSLLEALERALRADTPSEVHKKCNLQNEPKTEIASKAFNVKPPILILEATQDSDETVASGSIESLPIPAGSQQAELQYAQYPGPSQRISAVRLARPVEESSSPAKGYTMEEARKLGLVR